MREQPVYECPFLTLSSVDGDYLLVIMLVPNATCIKVKREQAIALALSIINHELKSGQR